MDSILWMNESWKEVTSTTINNCFKKAGFGVPALVSVDTDDDDDGSNNINEELMLMKEDMTPKEYSLCDEDSQLCEVFEED